MHKPGASNSVRISGRPPLFEPAQVCSLDMDAQRLLRRLLELHRNDILERATDWVIAQSVDLRGSRPREETRGLVERVIAANEAGVFQGDRGPADRLIEFVTSLRASSEFQVSTHLKGFLSFSKAVLSTVDRSQEDPRVVLSLANGLGDFYYYCAVRLADIYAAKLYHSVSERRQELETVLSARDHELQEKLATIQAQRDALASLSSPVISVGAGILLVPLVGEITVERADEAERRILDAIVEREARALILDITGLAVADSPCGAVLFNIIQGARLLGAEALIVGMSGNVAQTFLDLDIDLTGTRTFATLQEGLACAFRKTGVTLRRIANVSGNR